MFSLFVSVLYAEELELPQVQLIDGGWNSWIKMFNGLSSMFNGTNIGGYVGKTLDLNYVATDIVLTGINNFNINDYIKDFTEDFEPGDNSLFQNFSIDFSKYIGSTTEDYIGYGIGYGSTALIEIAFFIISFLYFFFYCFIICCCCKPKNRDNPNILSNICFIIGLVILSVCGIFGFIYSIYVNDMVHTVEYSPKAIPVAGSTIYDTLMNGINSLDNSISTLGSKVNSSLSLLVNALDKPEDEIIKFNQTAYDDIDFIVGNISEIIGRLKSAINESTTKINKNIEADLTQIGNNIDKIIINFEKENNVTVNQTEKDRIKNEISKVNITIPNPEIDVDLEKARQNGYKQIDPTINSTLKTIDSTRGTIRGMAESVSEPIMNMSIKNMTSSQLDGLKEFTSEESVMNSEIGSFIAIANEYIDEYYSYAKVGLYITAVLFFVIGAIYAAGFYTKCCCSRCMACCAECWPLATSILILLFGIVFTAIGFVFYVGGSQIFTYADNAFDAAVVSMTNPERNIVMPSINLTKYLEEQSGSGGSEIPFIIVTPEKNFTIAQPFHPLNALFSAGADEGLDQMIGLVDFLHLEELAPWLNETLNESIAVKEDGQIVMYIKGIIGDIDPNLPEDITKELGIDPDKDIDKGIKTVDDSKKEIKGQDYFNPDKKQKVTIKAGNVSKDLEFYVFDNESRDANEKYINSTLPRYDEALDVIKKALEEIKVDWRKAVNATYLPLRNRTYTLTDRWSKNLGSPSVGGYEAMYPDIAKAINGVVDGVNELVLGLSSSLDEIKVQGLTGIVGYAYNGLVLNFSNISCLISIICHIIFVGYFIIVVMMCIRRRGMASPDVAKANKRKESDEDEDTSMSAAYITRRSTKKHKRDSSSSSTSSHDDLRPPNTETNAGFWLQY